MTNTFYNQQEQNINNVSQQFKDINQIYLNNYSGFLQNNKGKLSNIEENNNKLLKITRNINSHIENGKKSINSIRNKVSSQDLDINRKLNLINELRRQSLIVEKKNVTYTKSIANTRSKVLYIRNTFYILIIFNILLLIWLIYLYIN